MFRVQSQLLPASLRAIREEMDRAFRDVPSACSPDAIHKIPLSLWENDSAFTVEFDLPGFSREDIDIQVDDGKLIVEAQRALPESEGECRYCDRRFLHGQRQFELPESVTGSGVEASLADGVLRLVLPKRPESKPHRVEISLPKAAAAEEDATEDDKTNS